MYIVHLTSKRLHEVSSIKGGYCKFKKALKIFYKRGCFLYFIFSTLQQLTFKYFSLSSLSSFHYFSVSVFVSVFVFLFPFHSLLWNYWIFLLSFAIFLSILWHFFSTWWQETLGTTRGHPFNTVIAKCRKKILSGHFLTFIKSGENPAMKSLS